MSDPKKLLVVLAATGSQGTAIINHFLAHEPSYKIRGTTRNTRSPKALALAAMGIEMVQAELTDRASLTAAFDGASVIYAYTDSAGCAQSAASKPVLETSLTDVAGALEIQQGKLIADAAAKLPTLERLIWSSTPDPTGSQYYNYEMASKAEILRYMRSLPALKGKVNAVYLAVFTESFVRFPQVIGWTPSSPSSYTVNIPWSSKAHIPWIDLHRDAGSWVSALVHTPGDVTVEAVSGEMSTEDVVKIMGTSLGAEIEIKEVTLEEYAQGDSTGVMEHIGKLMMWTAELGIGRSVRECIKAGEFAKDHPGVNRSNVRGSFEKIDWTSMLEKA